MALAGLCPPSGHTTASISESTAPQTLAPVFQALLAALVEELWRLGSTWGRTFFAKVALWPLLFLHPSVGSETAACYSHQFFEALTRQDCCPGETQLMNAGADDARSSKYSSLQDIYGKSVLLCHGRAYCLLPAMTIPHVGATGWPPTMTA